jgi:hypothetical protein
MPRSEAYDRFIASMKIDYMKWHDGEPYDLEALDAVSPEEQAELEALLIQRKDNDWRDVEALAKIKTPTALHALKECMTGPSREIRIRAAELLHQMGELDSLDTVIVEGLRFGELGEGLAQAERLAASHPSEAVKDTLLHGVLCTSDGRAVRFAGILLFLHGKASKPFDGSQQSILSRFTKTDRRERRQAFDELCKILGVDGSQVICEQNPARP